MNPLIGKLTTLMGEEYKKLKGVSKEVAFLRDELSAMNASLEKLGFMEKLEPNTKNWRDHVREMAYDMENCIDDFMQNIGGADANAGVGFMKRMSRRLKTLRVRHRIAGQIEDLKALAVEANERRIRYKIDDCNTSRGSVDIDPRISVIYEDVAGLVGTDGPKKEVLGLLTDTEKKLKVVSIVGFGGLELPVEIRGLVHLDTLDVPNGSIPSDIEHLPRLSNLTMGMGFYRLIGLPERIGIMESLRTLQGFTLGRSSVEALQGLGKLTNLRSLELDIYDGDERNRLEKAAKCNAFASSISKLHNLKYLKIVGDHDDKDDILGSVSDPPALIEEMYLSSWKMLVVPKWIGDLNCLHSVELSVRGTKNDGITILGGLPSLIYLHLRVATCPKEEAVIVNKGLFPVLERLTFISKEDVTAYLGFEAGAMPKLQELSLQLDAPAWGGAAPVGIEHHLGLQQISLIVWCKKKEYSEQVKLQFRSAFSNAVQLHPKPPSVDVKCYICL
ncbi:hypothetical protein ZWY2020_023152 [Hordeum vulgare]|nr:hypothetical protein ZWY2020_023152 [Hordeum vulgare]